MLKTESIINNTTDTKKLLDEEIRSLANAEINTNTPDEEYQPSLEDITNTLNKSPQNITEQNINGIPNKFPKDKIQGIIVDELLMSVPRAQGYYLKLYKELGPDQIQLKMKITNYEFWSDLEWEITQLVREQTKRDTRAYGSGKYIVVVWHDKGIRGEKRPPMEFYIDAEESKLGVPIGQNEIKTESVEDKLDGLAKVATVLQSFGPKPIDPTQQAAQIAESFRQGMAIATNKETSNESTMAAMFNAMAAMQKSNTDMLIALLSGNKKESNSTDELIKILTLTGAIGGKNKDDSPLHIIKEMREAGMIPKKEESGMEATLKTIVMLKDVAGDIFGGGGSSDSGGPLERLISGLAPKIPDIIGNVTKTINNVVALNKAKLARMNPAPVALQNAGKPIIKQVPTQIEKTTEQPTDESQGADEKMNILLKMFATKLAGWVKTNDTTKFDEVTKAIMTVTNGQPLIQDALKQDTMSTEDLAKFVLDFDNENYKTEEDMKALHNYIEEYSKYVKGEGDLFVVKCDKCGEEYNLDSKEEYEAMENKDCDNENCDGIVIPINTENIEATKVTKEGENNDIK